MANEYFIDTSEAYLSESTSSLIDTIREVQRVLDIFFGENRLACSFQLNLHHSTSFSLQYEER